jgi:glycosyltransferase involved in cell wall biosynthesis
VTETLTGSEADVATEGPREAGRPLETRLPAEEQVVDLPAVSIVVPFYNPGDRLRTTVERLIHALDGTALPFEIIAVSDGSTDGSPQSLDGFPDRVVRRVSYADNIGKGHALRTGLAMSRGRYVGFIDADGDISPDHLVTFLARMETDEADIVLGSKRHPGSSVRWTPLRRFYSWAHQFLVRCLFRIDVEDTQVGIKLMDRRVATDVLPLLRESRFALDLELLVLAKRMGHTHIVEEPVRIEERLDSTISMTRAWRLLLDTFHVFARLSLLRRDDAALGARRGTGSVAGSGGPVTITAPAASSAPAAPSALPAA